MASKGQKFAKYSPEIKEIILKEYFENQEGMRPLGRKYGIPYESIKNWVRKAKCNIDTMFDHRKENKGRPKNNGLTLEDYKERYEILKKYRAFLQARREKK